MKGRACIACHKGEKRLPDKHIETKDMHFGECMMCHGPGQGGGDTLWTKIPGSHIHALANVSCVQCHGKVRKPQAVTMNRCINCHGKTDTLAQKTAKVKPHNPHESPHYGTATDCNLCHHQHSKSHNYCSQCHDFPFVVP